MQTEQQNTHQLLEEVRQGAIHAYAWGVGYIFEACCLLHRIPLQFASHTAPELIEKVSHGLRIISSVGLLNAAPTATSSLFMRQALGDVHSSMKSRSHPQTEF